MSTVHRTKRLVLWQVLSQIGSLSKQLLHLPRLSDGHIRTGPNYNPNPKWIERDTSSRPDDIPSASARGLKWRLDRRTTDRRLSPDPNADDLDRNPCADKY